MGGILYFPGVRDRQGAHFAKCVYNKGMLLHINLMRGGGIVTESHLNSSMLLVLSYPEFSR